MTSPPQKPRGPAQAGPSGSDRRLRFETLDGKICLMTATLTLDNSGRLLLPAPILRVLGMQPGIEMKVEVTPGRIELLAEQADEVPLITELSPDGTL